MCFDDQAQPPIDPGAPGSASGTDLELTADDGNRFAAYLALPATPTKTAVLVLPDIRGLHQFYKDLALRLAEHGHAAIAMDYFGRTAGIGDRSEQFEFMPHVQQLRLPTLVADAKASLVEISAKVPGSALYTLGFCLGGTISFLFGAQPLGLSGVIGFYAGMKRDLGGGTLLEQAHLVTVPALGLFGGNDPGIPPEQVAELDVELDRAGVAHEIVSYPGAPHSFFDRRATDYAEASADAWQRVLAFLGAERA